MRRAATPDEYNEMASVNSDSRLVEISPRGPDGFIYQQNFISEAEEQELIRQFRHFTLRRSNTINLPGSGARLVLAGSTSSGAVKSQKLRTCRHFFYRSEHALEKSSTLIRTVLFKRPSLNIPLDPQSAGIGISPILALWSVFPSAEHAG